MKVDDKEKGKVKSEKGATRKPKAKMTAEQKACLAACKSFDADVDRAKYINVIADCVLRDMCKTCDHLGSCAADRKKFGCLVTMNCRMAAIASVVVGMIQEGGAKCRVVLERGTCTLRDGALEVKGGAK